MSESTPTLGDLKVPRNKPIILHHHKFFVSRKDSNRSYKFFHKLLIYHSTLSKREKFESFLDKIKYVKSLATPMILSIRNSYNLARKLKSLNKTIKESENLISHALTKGKLKNLEGEQKRIFKASKQIFEVFPPKALSLKILKTSKDLKKLEVNFFEKKPIDLLNDFNIISRSLHKLTALSINLPTFETKDFERFLIIIKNFSKLQDLEMSLLIGEDSYEWLKSFLLLKNLKKLTITTNQILKDAQKFIFSVIKNIEPLRELKIITGNFNWNPSFRDIEEFISQQGLGQIHQDSITFNKVDFHLENEKFRFKSKGKELYFLKKNYPHNLY